MFNKPQQQKPQQQQQQTTNPFSKSNEHQNSGNPFNTNQKTTITPTPVANNLDNNKGQGICTFNEGSSNPFGRTNQQPKTTANTKTPKTNTPSIAPLCLRNCPQTSTHKDRCFISSCCCLFFQKRVFTNSLNLNFIFKMEAQKSTLACF